MLSGEYILYIHIHVPVKVAMEINVEGNKRRENPKKKWIDRIENYTKIDGLRWVKGAELLWRCKIRVADPI